MELPAQTCMQPSIKNRKKFYFQKIRARSHFQLPEKQLSPVTESALHFTLHKISDDSETAEKCLMLQKKKDG
jgi:hypothetical protein